MYQTLVSNTFTQSESSWLPFTVFFLLTCVHGFLHVQVAVDPSCKSWKPHQAEKFRLALLRGQGFISGNTLQPYGNK